MDIKGLDHVLRRVYERPAEGRGPGAGRSSISRTPYNGLRRNVDVASSIPINGQGAVKVRVSIITTIKLKR